MYILCTNEEHKKTYCKNMTGTMDGKVQHTHTIHQHIQSLRTFLENN